MNRCLHQCNTTGKQIWAQEPENTNVLKGQPNLNQNINHGMKSQFNYSINTQYLLTGFSSVCFLVNSHSNGRNGVIDMLGI